MRNIVNFALCLLLSMTLFACVKDRGDYDYTTIPEASMTNFDIKLNGTSIEIPEVLTIEYEDMLDVVNQENLNFDAEYQWSIFEKSPTLVDDAYPQPVVIGTQKDLHYQMTLKPSTYILVCEVKNKTNNSKFTRNFEIKVSAISGLMVLYTDSQGKGDFSAVRTAEMFPDYPANKLGVNNDLYAKNLNGAKLDNPSHIFFRTTDRVTQSIFISVKKNLVQLNYNTYELMSDKFQSLFYFTPDAATFDCQYMNNGLNNKEQMIVSGQIYGVDYMSAFDGIYGSSFGTFGKVYAPFIINCNLNQSSRYHVVFNTTDKSFQGITIFNGMTTITDGGGAVNFGNTQMDLLYMDRGNGDAVDAVMKDAAGKIYYVRFGLSYDATKKTQVATCTLKTEIMDATNNSCWAISSRGNVAFFTVGNDVKLLNVSTGTVTSLNLGLSAGATLSKIQILKDATNTTYDNALLLIGVNENGNGKLCQYAFNPLSGTVDVTTKKEFDGFGTIVDFALKK